MTKLQIIQNVYEALGEPSDLQYFDDTGAVVVTSVGWKRLVDALNTALLEISVWKFSDGRSLRFRSLEDTATLQTFFESAVITDSVTGSNIITTTLTKTTLDAYAGCAIKVGEIVYRVRNSQVNILVNTRVDLLLDSAITATANTNFKLSKRDYFFTNQVIDPFMNSITGIEYIAAHGAPLEILNVYDVEANSELEFLRKYNPLVAVQAVFQTPAQFYKLSQGLRFESYPTETKLYTVRYVRGPKVMDYTTTNEVPELPPQFHEALVLYCLWWGYRRMQENTSAYATKQDLVDMLRRVRTEYDLQDEFTDHQLSFSMEG